MTLDPLGWLLQHGQAVGSDPLAGATAGAGVFALLTALYSTLALLRGQRRQRKLLDSSRREETRAAGALKLSTQGEVLEPTGGHPSRSLHEGLDLVIKPIEAKRPERTPAPAPRPPKPGPADVQPTPARPHAPQAPDLGASAARAPSPASRIDSPLLPDDDADLPALRSSEPLDAEGRVCQSFALLAEGRFEEDIEATREGLDAHPDAGRVFGQLSRVASLLGRKDQAIDLATRAYRADRSEERFEQLLRLRCAAHRFEPREGDRLRRAVAHDPEQPVYLRALGIFEALHGSVGTARRLLRAALRHETGEETRGAIARELLQLERSDEGRRFAARSGTARTSGLH
jgi:Flp pilus assembly protein TadD